jgi:hypothetical protein
MSQQIRPIDDKDLSKNWVNSSRFLFFTSVFCLLAFVFGCSYRLYNQRWKGTGEPVVPESTQYNPTYPALKK